uniref:S-phase kinase-associated protein 1 n=1 Tax=Aceria tosichella TaxID=561515 RepID=A0A6G1SE86_9ACAR
MTKIKLLSQDGEVFEVERDVIAASTTIKNMMDQIEVGAEDDEPIPLQNVTGAILKRVIQWAQYHRADKNENNDDDQKEKRSDDINSWDSDFLKVDQGTLFELLLAANYLGIDGLLDAACKTVANQIRGKQPEEIRKTFNIQNDFTQEEEAEVKLENQWCEEKN